MALPDPSAKISSYLTLPGAGTALGVVAGAVEALEAEFRFVGFAGTSGGGLVALALASGMGSKDVSALVSKMIQRTDLLDSGFPVIDTGPGLFRGRKVQALLQDVFGEKTMGDLPMPCRLGISSLWTRRVGLLDHKRHAEVLCWRAAYATMAIEGFFDPIRVRTDNARTYGDGGAGLNVPAGAWDDRAAPTVSVRFARQQVCHSLNELLAVMDGGSDPALVQASRDTVGEVEASFDLMMDAASASFPSRKPPLVDVLRSPGDLVATGFFEVVLESDADGLAFGVTSLEAERRRQQGVLSGRRALAQLQTAVSKSA